METQEGGETKRNKSERVFSQYEDFDLSTVKGRQDILSFLRDQVEVSDTQKEYNQFRDELLKQRDEERLRELFSTIIGPDSGDVTKNETTADSTSVWSSVGGRSRTPFVPKIVQENKAEQVTGPVIPEDTTSVDVNAMDMPTAEQNPGSAVNHESKESTESKAEVQKKIDNIKLRLIESTDGGVHKILSLPEVYKVYEKEYFVAFTNLNDLLRRFDDLTDEERERLPEMIEELDRAVEVVITAYKEHHKNDEVENIDEAENNVVESGDTSESVEVKEEVKSIPTGAIEIGPGVKPSEVVHRIALKTFPGSSPEEIEKIEDEFFRIIDDETRRKEIFLEAAIGMLLIEQKVVEILHEAKARVESGSERGSGVHENVGNDIGTVAYQTDAQAVSTPVSSAARTGTEVEEETKPETPVFTSETVKAENSEEDKLHTREVTTALGELLTNWFGGGGLFGMGKSGMEHPEFMQVKDQLVDDLRNGDVHPDSKVKPDTLESIKANVQAWKDTYGIFPNNGELFEHYLRRVIIASNKHGE